MGDVLTKEERAKQIVANVRLQAIKSFDSGAWNDSATVDACDWLLGLVSEVERLRARNEALEKVAKAAAKLDEWDIGKFMTCEECGHTDQNEEEIDTAYCAMSAALSALRSEK